MINLNPEDGCLGNQEQGFCFPSILHAPDKDDFPLPGTYLSPFAFLRATSYTVAREIPRSIEIMLFCCLFNMGVAVSANIKVS